MSKTFYFTMDLSWEMHFLVASVKQPLPISPRHAAPPWLGGHVETKKPVPERNVSCSRYFLISVLNVICKN